MGTWSSVKINKIRLDYKYRVPYYALSIFEPRELLIKIDDYEVGYPIYSFVGYQTSIKNALTRMEQSGYTSDFFAEVLVPHLEDFDESYLELLSEGRPNEEITSQEIDRRATELENISFEPIIRKDVDYIEQYVDFLKCLIDGRKRNALFRRLKFQGVSEEIIGGISLFDEHGAIEYDDLWGIPLELCYYLPTGIVHTAHVMVQICDEYGDFYELFTAWLLLSATPIDRQVALNFAELLDSLDPKEVEEEAKSIFNDIRSDAANKLTAYNRAFSILAEKDPSLAIVIQKQKIKDMLSQTLSEADNYVKGKLLEDLVVELFHSDQSFLVSSKRLNNDDEEIDVVFINNSENPFIQSLHSPIIMVECKNWSTTIGVNELRNFESKIRNHYNLCKVGIFVAIKGFTKTADDYLKRLGRDSPILILVSQVDIEHFIEGDLTLESWFQVLVAGSLA